MKTKTKFLTKLLTVFAVLSFAFAFCLMAITGQPNNAVAETAEGYNLFDINKISLPNKATATNLGLTYVSNNEGNIITSMKRDGGHDVLSIVCNTTTEAHNFQSNNISWKKDVEYTISFSIKVNAKNESKSWFIRPRVYVNGIQNNGDSSGVGYFSNASGACTDWTEFTYKFTPNQSTTSGNNFVFFWLYFYEGDKVDIRDIAIIEPVTAYSGQKNILESGIRTARGVKSETNENGTDLTQVKSSDENPTVDEVYGKVNTLTYNAAVAVGSNDIYHNDNVLWTKGATYTVFFMVRTSAAATAKAYVQVRIPGLANKDIIPQTSILNGSAVECWKPVYYTFTIDDSWAAGTGTSKQFMLVMSGGAAGDVVYYTDIKVYANVSTVTVSENGKTTSTENVLTGSEYTLPAYTATEGKAFVGWDVNGKLYQTGDSITVNGDTSISAVALEYATAEGAYLRLSTENPGIRFTATVDKTAVENALSSYGTVTGYGMRITSDDIEGHLDISVSKWSSDAQKGFVCAVTGFEKALTDKGLDFYNVKFKATAYVTITLNAAEGEEAKTITVYANTTEAGKSIVDMAKACKDDTTTYNALPQDQKNVVDTFADYTPSSSQGGN